MILTGAEIESGAARGDITLREWRDSSVNPNSYNFRLAADLLHVGDPTGLFDEPVQIELDDAGVVLRPGNLYLGATAETIGSSRYAMTLLGRSSMGRLGLFLNATADLGHVGSCSRWTLELSVVQPLRVYPRLAVGQIAFWHQAGPVIGYQGRYHGDDTPVACRDLALRNLAA